MIGLVKISTRPRRLSGTSTTAAGTSPAGETSGGKPAVNFLCLGHARLVRDNLARQVEQDIATFMHDEDAAMEVDQLCAATEGWESKLHGLSVEYVEHWNGYGGPPENGHFIGLRKAVAHIARLERERITQAMQAA